MATSSPSLITRFETKLLEKNGHTPNAGELKVLEAMFESIVEEIQQNGEAYNVDQNTGIGKIR